MAQIFKVLALAALVAAMSPVGVLPALAAQLKAGDTASPGNWYKNSRYYCPATKCIGGKVRMCRYQKRPGYSGYCSCIRPTGQRC